MIGVVHIINIPKMDPEPEPPKKDDSLSQDPPLSGVADQQNSEPSLLVKDEGEQKSGQDNDDIDDIDIDDSDDFEEESSTDEVKMGVEVGVGDDDEINQVNDDDDSLIEDDSEREEEDQFERKNPLFFGMEKKKTQNNHHEKIKLREYQWLLFEESKGKNSIIYLPTGTGKTMVAIASMYYVLCREGESRKIVFLANTIQLVKQQAEAIKKNLLRIIKDEETARDLRGERTGIVKWTEEDIRTKVCCIHGEKNEELGVTRRKKIESELTAKKEMIEQFNKSTIIVMISQIFLNCLRRGYIRLPDCSMLVMDECHHCAGEHPYAGIMKEFYFKPPIYFDLKGKEIPKTIIMGLTASPVAQPTFNKNKLVKELKELAEHLDSKFAYYEIEKLKNETDIQIIKTEDEDIQKQTFPHLIALFQKYRDHYVSYQKLQIHFPRYFECVKEVVDCLISRQEKLGLEVNPNTLTDIDLLLFYDVKECLLIKLRDLWLELGEYAFTLGMNELISTLQKIILKSEENKAILNEIIDILISHAKKFQQEFGRCERKFFSAKVNKLIDLLSKEKETKSLVQEERKVEMVLVFAAKRRTVKYLEQLLREYKNTLEDEQEAKRFECKGVTGYSAKTFSNFSKNEVIYYSDISGERNYAEIDRKYQLYLDEMSERSRLESNVSQGESENLTNEMKKMKNVKYGKLLLEVEEKYSNQIKKINEFKKKKYRILITTSVTEEGFDIPECNMVISFDEPRSLKSYIQIKGRARKSNSQYIIFTTNLSYTKMIEDKEMFEDTIKATEQFAINKFAKNQDLNGKKIERRPFVHQQEYQRRIVKETGAIINTNYSLEILKLYCSSLRSPNKPKFYFIETPNIAYRCIIYFPPTATTTRPYMIGRPEKSKKNAMRSASFEAVLYLYKQGYIKNDLRPKRYEELEDEREIQKFEDIAETKKNEIYRRIFEEEVRVRIDNQTNQIGGDRKFIRFHFKSIPSHELDFPQVNPEFKNHIPTFQKQQFRFQIYKMNFKNQQNMKELKKGENVQEIGILTCFQEKYIDELFTNYHYSFEENNAEGFEFPLACKEVCLKKPEYERLKKVHDFIIASVENNQHGYYRNISETETVKSGWISQIKKYSEKFIINKEREFYPILVVLKQKGNQSFIDEKMNAKIEDHIKLFTELYRYHNVGSHTETVKKFPINLTEKIKSFTSEILATKDYDKYVVQSIEREECFRKYVIEEKHLYNEEMDKGKHKNRILGNKMKKMKKMFEHLHEVKDVVKVKFWGKYRKEKKGKLFRKQSNMLLKKSNQTKFYLLEEFYPYPINPSLLFKASLASEFAFKALYEYSVAFSFRNIQLNAVIMSKMPYFEKVQPYACHSYENIILENASNIFRFLVENSGSEYLRTIGKTYEKGTQFIKPQFEFSFSLNESMIQKKNMSLDESSLNMSGLILNTTENNIPKFEEPVSQESSSLYSVSEVNIKITEMLKVLTSRMYKMSKFDNYEEYEFIGDVVLKMLSTVEAFLERPNSNESELHIYRANIICNANLHRKAIMRRVYKYIFAKKYTELPPPFCYKTKQELGEKLFYEDTKIKMYDENSDLEGFQYIPGKVHADVIQALIGAFYLNSRNLEDCQSLLYAFDVLKKPNLCVTIKNKDVSDPANLPKIYRDFEERIKYNFHNKGLLLQAFTHSSFQSVLHIAIDKHNISDLLGECDVSVDSRRSFMSMETSQVNNSTITRTNPSETFYERLQFLGDSILDLIVVEYLYEKYGTKDEGSLTLLKQAGVSNRSLGMIALQLGMHELILMDHPDNDHVMRDFKKIEYDFNRFLNDPGYLIESKIDSIKLLGDVFEALIGAIFLDQGMKYVETKRIVIGIMKKFLDHYTDIEESKNSSNSRYQDYLQKNNYTNCQIKKDYQTEIDNGRFRYILVDRTGNQIDYCWEMNEKRAWDVMIEKFHSKNTNEK